MKALGTWDGTGCLWAELRVGRRVWWEVVSYTRWVWEGREIKKGRRKGATREKAESMEGSTGRQKRT